MLDFFDLPILHAKHLTAFDSDALQYKLSGGGGLINLDATSEDACRQSCTTQIERAHNAGSTGLLGTLTKDKSQDETGCQLYCYNSFSTSICFAGDSLVTVRGLGVIPMTEVRVGQFVLTPKGFQEILCWIHRDAAQPSQFLEIEHQGGHIRLSANHYIMVAQGTGYKAKPASEVTLQDQLRVMWCDMSICSSPIKSIRTVTRTGFFAPLTASGTLFVDNVFVSCYAVPKVILETPFAKMLSDCHLAAHAAMLPLRWYYRKVSLPEEDDATALAFCQFWLSAYSSVCGIDAPVLTQKQAALPPIQVSDVRNLA